MKLLVENLRCFEGKHELNIKPLTILVGENSSGKTTLLSALFAALQPDYPAASAFNRAPFELGSFDTIATYRGGAYGRAPQFSIGWESDSSERYRRYASFVNHLDAPRLHRVELDRGTTRVVADLQAGEWTVHSGEHSPLKVNVPAAANFQSTCVSFLQTLFGQLSAAKGEPAKRVPIKALEAVQALLFAPHSPRAIALSPLRTQPRRNYDDLTEEFTPDGKHIPLVLAQRLSGVEMSDLALRDAVERFGSESGLFTSLKVRRLGRSRSGAFQLRVKSVGPDANLVDVGYGVSQSLPVVVESILAPEGMVTLVQQPEVHLHPRAQAALGTFFSSLVKRTKRRFVIETHSDYLLDRVRQSVASGVIAAEDVGIAFVERSKLDVKIHELRLDPLGNITNAPRSYRRFFLDEEMRLLSRGQ